MARTKQLVAEGTEYSTDYNEDDELAFNTMSYQIIENAQKRGYLFAYICGRNIDWMSNSGFKFLRLELLYIVEICHGAVLEL